MILNDNEISALSFADDRPIVHPFRGYETNLDGVRVVFGYSVYLHTQAKDGERPRGIVVSIKRGNATAAHATPTHVKIGAIFSNLRILFAWLEQPYANRPVWPNGSRVPLALKNF